MNITGVANYTREVGTMRAPTHNTSVLNKLIFTYPFGIDQSLANIPFNTFVKGDADTISDAFRAFFSVSVLKEIFISNSLNLVTTASTFERYRSVSPSRSVVLVNNLLRGGSMDDSRIYVPQRDIEPSDIDPVSLQSKIKQNFEQIKQSVKTDPRLKKFLPFMQVITLRNMIDVPVITGTAAFQLDTTALFTLLATAISTRTKLNDWGNVRKLTSKLNSMTDITVYQMMQILNNANAVNTSTRMPSRTDYFAQKKMQLDQELANASDRNKPRIQQKIDEFLDKNVTMEIANLKDSKMKELERNLMFMMDPQRLMQRYGFSRADSQASSVFTKVNPQIDLLFDRTKSQFIDFLGGADGLLQSVYMVFQPLDPSNPAWGENYLSCKNNLINHVLNSFDSYTGNLKTELITGLSGDLEDSSNAVSYMNKSCDSAREDFIFVLKKFNEILIGNMIPPDFNEANLKMYANTIDKVVTMMNPIMKNTITSIKQLFKNSSSNILRTIETIVNDAVNEYFKIFNKTRDFNNQLRSRFFELDVGGRTGNPVADLERLKRYRAAFQVMTAEATNTIFTTIFLLIFKVNLCDFVEVADVEFDIAKNDVLDLPNYCLVIPIEVAQALWMIYTVRDWKTAVAKSGQGFNPLQVSYIKGIVKLFRMQLGIPNLMVYDQKRSELYYSFQYMGTNTEKIKLQALELFVQHHIKDQSTGIEQVYY